MARQRSSGRKTDYTWELARGSDFLVAAGGDSVRTVGDFTQAETLIRIRGEVLVWLDPATSEVGDALEVAWGVLRAPTGILSEVGVNPIQDGGAPWVAYGVATLASEIANFVGVNEGSLMKRFEVDNKAMRKLRDAETLYFVLRTSSIVGSPTMNYGFMLRFLTGR